MSTVGQLFVLALLVTVILFVHIIACALYQNWWPLAIYSLGYILLALCSCCACSRGGSAFSAEDQNAHLWAAFCGSSITSIVGALPFVMWHVGGISLGAALMHFSGFILANATACMALFFSGADDGLLASYDYSLFQR